MKRMLGRLTRDRSLFGAAGNRPEKHGPAGRGCLTDSSTFTYTARNAAGPLGRAEVRCRAAGASSITALNPGTVTCR